MVIVYHPHSFVFRPCDCVYANDETREAFDHNYDEFGDSFSSPSDMDSLKYSIARVREQGCGLKNLKSADIADFEQKHDITKYGLFRTFKAFFHEGRGLSSITFQFYGGQVRSNSTDAGLCYYFVSAEEGLSLHEVQKIKAERRKIKDQFPTFKIVTDDWIEDCIEKGELISDKDYEL